MNWSEVITLASLLQRSLEMAVASCKCFKPPLLYRVFLAAEPARCNSDKDCLAGQAKCIRRECHCVKNLAFGDGKTKCERKHLSFAIGVKSRSLFYIYFSIKKKIGPSTKLIFLLSKIVRMFSPAILIVCSDDFFSYFSAAALCDGGYTCDFHYALATRRFFFRKPCRLCIQKLARVSRV